MQFPRYHRQTAEEAGEPREDRPVTSEEEAEVDLGKWILYVCLPYAGILLLILLAIAMRGPPPT